MTSTAMHRRVDCPTSIAATRLVLPTITDLQRTILEILRLHPNGMTDLELERQPAFSSKRPSTIRKRRLELVRLGYVRNTGRTRGRLTVWAAVAANEIAAPPPSAINRPAVKRPKPPPRKSTWTSEETALID